MVKIMIDAGHDLNTAGKGVVGLKEFTFNRVVAEKLKTLLETFENVEVYFSHDLYDGIDTPLEQRTNYANKLKVDLFISIHANAGVSTARGIETYIHPIVSDETIQIANLIHGYLIQLTRQKDRGVKRANFHVLRETNMNAVLVELGFMTNADDLILLKSDVYRTLCAEGICRGIEQHYRLKKKIIKPPETNGQTFYRVVTGSFGERANAEKRMNELKSKGFDSFIETFKK